MYKIYIKLYISPATIGCDRGHQFGILHELSFIQRNYLGWLPDQHAIRLFMDQIVVMTGDTGQIGSLAVLERNEMGGHPFIMPLEGFGTTGTARMG